jgi:hypothetical protein
MILVTPQWIISTGMLNPDSLEMKMMRPQPAAFIFGSKLRLKRTPLMKFGFDDVVPIGIRNLLERLDVRDAQIIHQDFDIRNRCKTVSAASARDQSAANPSSCEDGSARRISSAAATRASARPLTTTRARSPARAFAIGSPMPAIAPVTSLQFNL